MTLNQRLQAEMTSAMRNQDAFRRDTLRMAVAAVRSAEKDARRDLTDDEVVAVLAREVKRRRESVDAYENAGRPELAARERQEAELLGRFLPAPLGPDELRAMVAAAIAETGAGSPRELGRVMGALAPRIRGRADGKTVSGLVAAELTRLELAAHDGVR